jgi:D-alanyl-D-alanine carboxypeptidase
MAPGPARVAPLRGNGRRIECFLRPGGAGGRRAIGVSIHRKSDGIEVARGSMRLTGRAIRLRIDRAGRGFVPRLVEGELASLLAARYPRRRIEISHARTPVRIAGAGTARSARPGRTRVRAAPDPAARRLAAVRAEIPPDYGPARELAPQREPRWLALAGHDHAGRECWLAPEALRAWRRMAGAADAEGISLVLVSGFRSAEYQARILAAKRARGLPMADILAVNAAPGYSEHHTGRALDLTTAGCRPAEPEFEATAAFRWLAARAREFGFRMSYPRGNPHGIVPEPWHWYFAGFVTRSPPASAR